MREFKNYTVRKTVRLTRIVVAKSARRAVVRSALMGDVGAIHSTTGWWCRKDRK